MEDPQPYLYRSLYINEDYVAFKLYIYITIVALANWSDNYLLETLEHWGTVYKISILPTILPICTYIAESHLSNLSLPVSVVTTSV